MRANKSWRQGTFIAAGIAQYMADECDIDMYDDGDLDKFKFNWAKMLEGAQPRQPLPPNPSGYNFYVNNVTGNDANDGLTADTAWATIQHATNTMLNKLDFNSNRIFIHVADGTYSSWAHIGNPAGCLGAESFNYVGNPTNPQNVVIQGNTSWGCSLFQANAQAVVRGFKFVGTGDGFTAGIYANGNAAVFPWDCDFGNMAGGHHMLAESGGYVGAGWAPNRISGGAGCCMIASTGGMIGGPGRPNNTFTGGPFSITITGNPTFSLAFVLASKGANVGFATGLAGFGGTCVGTRFLCSTNSTIDTLGRGVNFFPGTVAGTVDATTFATYL